ncbi:short-chain collagen C4-like isoform X1 [Mytilus californianus]|uniref:short-chain collagen C4-like isoform X1 n=1 Tax=Mytilus californianus TaxID=6549 RepID=UPI002247B100|nr:short-chain collagen C4-like isoform X1 [Mytilus californianus]
MNMFLSCLTFVLATVILVVENHECKDFVLSASDQSLIDMMKHYLHTSRRDDCPQPGKTSNTGVTYVRWGNTTCPTGVELVYKGQVGGNEHQNKGGGVNYLCLPNDPENGQHQPYSNDQVYGGEYQLNSSMKPSGWSVSNDNKEVPCAVCFKKRKSVILMIPGRKTCYKGWTSEYHGYLMSDHTGHNKKDYACVDINAEPLDNKKGNENGALFYPLRTKCGSLRCPPYTNEADVLCVVCTK